MKGDAKTGWSKSGIREFFIDDGVVAKVFDASSTKLLGCVDSEKASTARSGEERPIDHAIVVPTFEIGGDFSFDEGTNRLAKQIVFFGENGSAHESMVGERCPVGRPGSDEPNSGSGMVAEEHGSPGGRAEREEPISSDRCT